ncbi:type 2 isopentenyl-diphosphate Delta-isomerase [Paenibacillus puerhi]|uniref:type 2 isopentenyl-diphosphate Delta-isomerase n=1 Tax=Paenibacillus puerhi TaxID=2692622 RepID=UPI0019163725|nr:type 2 isopentenyl-diphosphate Delta-isomerase [Paenibacillus puerhi]
MEHVHHALQLGQSGLHGLDDVKLIPNCLPGTSTEHIAISTQIGELSLSSPIIINAMTGGARETEEINRELAVAARETGLAMAVGSQMSAIKNPEVASSYRVVREINPDGFIFGNLGSEATTEQAECAVEMIGADALQIHLNVMQELIMPEGDRDFTGMLGRIRRIVETVGVPVIVKEVGFGMARESAEALREAGVRIIDVGGAGGTNFAAIENARRVTPLDWLNDWGANTAISLLEVLQAAQGADGFGADKKVAVIATGGIDRALDIAKSLVLGASAVGMAGAMLRVQRQEGTPALIAYIRALHQDLRLVMTALGAEDLESLRRVPVVIRGETAEWCIARGIDLQRLANRDGYIYSS